ncbi:glycosyltransferase family 2 protein [Pseudomonas sp. SR9]|jgi:glycosyltransferase involved in cell wall biosynthesis|uniref:Glycosyltransferase family 2 protein n=1 Tax=Aquipseudomonas guryensis TaxID=2759165 RepID=A0A7W4D9X3_9GAMM|nr:glycosyltransferase family 2 protein [Pseudomonas guryensis]
MREARTVPDELLQARHSRSSDEEEVAAKSTVAILLSTFNGEKYLAEQLDSIAAQTHQDWVIVASDDGSQDSTLSILEHYRRRFGDDRLRIVKGPGRGFAANFLSMATDTSIHASFFAFCDQDDLWHPDKLERALTWLEQQPLGSAALYCSRTRLVDATGHPQGLSPLFDKPPSFRNALVQSLAGGNTMVFNRPARDLLAQAGNVQVISHDWWFYILATGHGGHVHYDPKPTIDYRQHGSNLIGANSGISDRIFRIRRMLLGDFNQWNDVNLNALAPQVGLLTQANRVVLDRFSKARTARLPLRVQTMLRAGVYRQTLLGNLGLVAATLLRKI